MATNVETNNTKAIVERAAKACLSSKVLTSVTINGIGEFMFTSIGVSMHISTTNSLWWTDAQPSNYSTLVRLIPGNAEYYTLLVDTQRGRVHYVSVSEAELIEKQSADFQTRLSEAMKTNNRNPVYKDNIVDLTSPAAIKAWMCVIPEVYYLQVRSAAIASSAASAAASSSSSSSSSSTSSSSSSSSSAASVLFSQTSFLMLKGLSEEFLRTSSHEEVCAELSQADRGFSIMACEMEAAASSSGSSSSTSNSATYLAAGTKVLGRDYCRQLMFAFMLSNSQMRMQLNIPELMAAKKKTKIKQQDHRVKSEDDDEDECEDDSDEADSDDDMNHSTVSKQTYTKHGKSKAKSSSDFMTSYYEIVPVEKTKTVTKTVTYYGKTYSKEEKARILEEYSSVGRCDKKQFLKKYGIQHYTLQNWKRGNKPRNTLSPATTATPMPKLESRSDASNPTQNTE